MTQREIDNGLLIVLLTAGIGIVLCLVILTWIQIDYNTKLIHLQIDSCQQDPQHCDPNLYTEYHK